MLEILTGPLLKLALTVFAVGLLVRVVLYIKGLDWRLERVAYAYGGSRGVKGAIWSVFKWLIPFGTHSWRKQLFTTIAFFLFHAGVVICPLFLAGHMILLEETVGFSLPSLPTAVGDVLAALGFLGGVMLMLRRITLPQVRILTDKQDWAILVLCLITLGSGIIARYQFGAYDFWLTLHVLAGEIILFIAPFTKLSHIALFFASRAQLGMDFAIKRGGATRGPAFPW